MFYIRASWYTLSQFSFCAPVSWYTNECTNNGIIMLKKSAFSCFGAFSPIFVVVISPCPCCCEAAFNLKIVLCLKKRRAILMWTCCYKCWWDNEIWSKRSTLSNTLHPWTFKTRQTLKHYTAVYLTVRQDFTTVGSHRCSYHCVFCLNESSHY